MRRSITCTALLAGLLLAAATPGRAAILDLLPTYTGPQGLDLDVLSAGVQYNMTTERRLFTTTVRAPIGTTPGALYVFGLDRGSGTERFVTGTPAIGQGVTFDSALIVNSDGTGSFNDIINSVVTPLAAGSVKFGGATLTALLSANIVPAAGRAIEDWTFNLRPRVGIGSNDQISDFAPDGSNAALTITPIPATAPLLAAAFGLGGLLYRRRIRKN